MHVSGDAKIAETEDGCFLDVSVQNHLPCVRKKCNDNLSRLSHDPQASSRQ